MLLCLSTTSSLQELSPAQRIHWSARTRAAGIFAVQAPIVEMPFDVWREESMIHENERCLDDTITLEFMVRFGRPLYMPS